MMDLRRPALQQCLLQWFQRQRGIQMVADLPSSDHSGEDVHEQSDIDEASLETDVGNIGHPDLILSRDLKGLNSIDP